jgi:catechol 2,3-dioxygenase-like lactoylglutathione lyase family enzyme
MKLRHARIVTKDVRALAQFYQEITGVKPEGSDDYLEFRTSDGVFAISSQQKMDEHGAGATVPAANHSMVLDFEVEDVDKERARLESIVQQFVLDPKNQPWGNRSMLFRDPDGNLVNFFTPRRSAAIREDPVHAKV